MIINNSYKYLLLLANLSQLQSSSLTSKANSNIFFNANNYHISPYINDQTYITPFKSSPYFLTEVNQTPQQLSTQSSCGAFKSKFKDGLNPKFTYEGPVTTSNGNLQVKFSKGDTPNSITGIIQGYGGTASSAQPYLYGKFTARLKTARIPGVVTAFILMSAEKDEIDWEWVGKDEFSSQTNYFYKGIEDYTKGQTFPNNFNTHSEFHNYGIIWTPEYISWTIDNTVVRTVTKESTKAADGTYHFPNTPAFIKLNVWDGGVGAEGTRNWAGDFVNYNDAEYLANGGFISTDVAWVKYECI